MADCNNKLLDLGLQVGSVLGLNPFYWRHLISTKSNQEGWKEVHVWFRINNAFEGVYTASEF